ncbi:permease [Gemmata sp. JC717]|uniref:permease n=1 Tax=Gemmata algarum TaxID=2975278 RepID=UPI0021BB1724|nr:permease [Gemmata algarum]MDY3556941.1 permease [Gemmata algarum]
MIESTFWGFLLRCGQGAVEAALTLLVGVVVAGVFRRMLGPAGTRRLFGSGFKGLFRGWLAGMLLPVCSLGVIPVAREMRRAGVPGGTVLAFVLAAPLLNPLSFLYGLTLAEPVVIVTFAALSLVLSTLAGLLWDRVFARATDAAESDELARRADAEPLPPVGLKRVLAVLVTAARELAGRDLAFYAVGIVGSAALSAALPFGSLQHTMHHSDKSSPLLMTALAVPLYSSPLPGMMKIGLMFEHGNSIGAAFVLFALGIGTSLGTLVWLFTDFGPRRAARWFAAYVGIILAMGYASEPLLYDTRKAEADHTHAFDDYSAPFPAGSGGPAEVRAKLAEKFGPLEQPAGYGFLALLALGLVARRADRAGRLERWLTTAPAPDRARSRWDVVVPGPVLGAIALLGLVAFSVVGAYLYYPDRRQCFEDMRAVHAEAVVAARTGKRDEAIRHLEHWDLLTRKLQVGVYIRDLAVTGEQAKASDDLREELEEVRDALIARDTDGAQARLPKLEAAYRACRAAYVTP